MSIDDSPWSSTALEAEDTHLVQLPADVIGALSQGDLEGAWKLSDAALTTWPLTPYLMSPECLNVWRRMSSQCIAAAPHNAAWTIRLLVDFGAQRTVGWAGFHGPPDPSGRVEIGYAVDPAHRRKGYGRAALVILLEKAEALPEVRAVHVKVSVDNALCRRLVTQYGFVEIGELEDDESEPVIIFELTIPGFTPSSRFQPISDATAMGLPEREVETPAKQEDLQNHAHPSRKSALRRRLEGLIQRLTNR